MKYALALSKVLAAAMTVSLVFSAHQAAAFAGDRGVRGTDFGGNEGNYLIAVNPEVWDYDSETEKEDQKFRNTGFSKELSEISSGDAADPAGYKAEMIHTESAAKSFCRTAELKHMTYSPPRRIKPVKDGSGTDYTPYKVGQIFTNYYGCDETGDETIPEPYNDYTDTDDPDNQDNQDDINSDEDLDEAASRAGAVSSFGDSDGLYLTQDDSDYPDNNEDGSQDGAENGSDGGMRMVYRKYKCLAVGKYSTIWCYVTGSQSDKEDSSEDGYIDTEGYYETALTTEYAEVIAEELDRIIPAEVKLLAADDGTDGVLNIKTDSEGDNDGKVAFLIEPMRSDYLGFFWAGDLPGFDCLHIQLQTTIGNLKKEEPGVPPYAAMTHENKEKSAQI